MSLPGGNKRILYMIGALSRPQVINLINNHCTAQEKEREQEILQKWETAANRLRQIEQTEQLAQNLELGEIEDSTRLQEISNNPNFQNTFSNTTVEFKTVHIENLIAKQREVQIDHIERITTRIPENPTMDDLIDICISPQQETPEIKVIGQGNQFSFSSPSNDFRFLGGFLKENLSEEDLRQCKVGGMPEKAIMLFVGYGGGAINVLRVGNRLILNNGFHRVYALRQRNITQIPVVIQNIGNPNLDLPQITTGVPNGYFLQSTRPIVTRDFFDVDLVETLEVKDTITNVRITFGNEASLVPI